MDSEIKKNLFYRPELAVERDYSSSGKFKYETEIQETPDTAQTSELEKLYIEAKENEQNLIKIKNVLPALPKEVRKILDKINDFLFLQTELELNEIVDRIIQEEQDEAKETYVEKTGSQETDTVYTESVTSPTDIENSAYADNSIYIDDQGFVWDDIGTVDINISVTKAKSSAEQAQDQYLKDSTDLKEEYLTEINNVIEEYVYPLTTYMSETGISMKSYLDREYDAACISGVPNNAKHLHDTIARNDILINEIGMLMELVHSTYKTLNVFTAWDVAAQQRIRYYAEEYKADFTTYLEIKANDMLTDLRQTYDDKYAMAKINAYKHLHSAVELTKAICEKDLESKSAKCYLLGKGVNIFETVKYDTMTISNSSTAGVVGEKAAVPANSSANPITGQSAQAAQDAAKNAKASAKATATSAGGDSIFNPNAISDNLTNKINGVLGKLPV